MKTSQYFIDDTPLQIIYLDNNTTDGRSFFENGLGTTWFDYELQMIEQISETDNYLVADGSAKRNLDLLLISNSIWSEGGEELVRQMRMRTAYANLPIYCVLSCNKKISHLPENNCWSKDWRKKTDCNRDARITAIPYACFLDPDHPSHINGTICANNISTEIPRIVDQMTAHWFQASGS